ncbi:MAG: DUF2089 domain-containing protein [Betaproteobacteria bacterium]
MSHDWQVLTKLTGGRSFVVERVRLTEDGVAIEGSFELPALAQLPAEDQVFVAAFVRSHGSIKQMEKFFGVSYPTIKNRLNRIGEQLPSVRIDQPSTELSALLDRIERGELTAREALARLDGDEKETDHE